MTGRSSDRQRDRAGLSADGATVYFQYMQGIAAFTALQRREIPSRLVMFPGGSHWVLKPNENRQWYGQVLGWIVRWTGRGAAPGAADPPGSGPTPEPGPTPTPQMTPTPD